MDNLLLLNYAMQSIATSESELSLPSLQIFTIWLSPTASIIFICSQPSLLFHHSPLLLLQRSIYFSLWLQPIPLLLHSLYRPALNLCDWSLLR